MEFVECFCAFSIKRLTKPNHSTSKSRGGSLKPPSVGAAPLREDEMREVFRCFDRDGDGRISAAELRSYFASGGEYMSLEDAGAIIEYLDRDKDELVDFEDFVRLMEGEGEGEVEGQEEDLRAAFGVFEKESGSGGITATGLQRVLGKLGDPKSYEECVAMIGVFDLEGKGKLGFHEFLQMMTATPQLKQN